MKHDHEDLLRRLALSDEDAATVTLAKGAIRPAGLDPKTWALVRLAGLIAVSSASASYQSSVTVAHAAGASDDEVVGVLMSVAPLVGTARVVDAAADLALALGYDVDLAFENPEATGQRLSTSGEGRKPTGHDR